MKSTKMMLTYREAVETERSLMASVPEVEELGTTD